jgi:flagellar hook-associated protein 3 FlgL
MRANQTTTYRSLQAFLDRTTDRLETLQLQAATGKRLNRPSDDPTAISPVLSARTQIQTSNRYIETIESGLDRIDNMEGYLDRMENVLVRAKEISIATVNDTLSAKDRATYADEMEQLRADLIDAGNGQVDGKFLFAGFSEKTKPFTATNPALPVSSANPMVYNGDNGAQNFEISPNELIEVNITGNALLMGDADNNGVTDAGAVNIFEVMTAIEEALRANNPAVVEAEMDNLEVGADQVRRLQSLKGNLARRLETARDHMQQIKVDMEEFRSRFEDADILETITEMEQQQQSFQAALSVTGKVSELSILDYL